MNVQTPPQTPIDMRPHAILTRLYLVEELRRVGEVLLRAKKCVSPRDLRRFGDPGDRSSGSEPTDADED